ncbi:MAG TPA: hypothetical protein VIU29_01875 [Candidatus Deferrimicrobiaceae bacterium]
MEGVKVVVHFVDGRILKGTTADFFPNKTLFHLDQGESGKGLEVQLQELKAVFWVKDFAGDPSRNESKSIDPGQAVTGRKAEVTFKDGETLVGTTLGYDPKRPGFFITTTDPQSNNQRLYVVSAAVKGFRFL